MDLCHNTATALYARVSSEKQAEAGTIESQVAALKERIGQDGYTVADECCFIDDGYTGSTLIRPALERLRDAVAAGGVERLYVLAPDRLARKYAYQVLLVDEFRRQGVEIIFLNHKLGESPEEEMLLQMQGMIAEYERAKILERCRRGKLHAARQGAVSVLHGAPYGYRYVNRQEGAGRARYEIVFEQARVIRQVFDWAGRDRCSLGEISRRLTKAGVNSPTGRPHWDRGTLWAILRNTAYTGRAAFGRTRVAERKVMLRPRRGVPAQPRRLHVKRATPREEWVMIPVPALVDEGLFSAVQAQLAENRERLRRTAPGNRYLLQGLLVCKQCGYAYTGKSKNHCGRKGQVEYYRCNGTTRQQLLRNPLCRNRMVRRHDLDVAVWEDVCALLADPQRVEHEYQRRLDGNPGNSELDLVRRTITKVKTGIARLIDAYSEGLLEKTEFEPRMRRAKERLAQLDAECQAEQQHEVEAQELRLVIGRLQDFAARVKAGLGETPWPTRREIIRALVKRIEVDDQMVRVVYRVNPSPFAEAAGQESGGVDPCCWNRPSASQRGPRPVGRPVRRVAGEEGRGKARGEQEGHGFPLSPSGAGGGVSGPPFWSSGFWPAGGGATTPVRFLDR